MCPDPQPPQELLGVDVGLSQHPPILETRTLHWPDEAACAASAAVLAMALRALPTAGDAFIALHGPLGAGKTTFGRHLLHALGVAGRIRSPSYALLEQHRADGIEIAHLDFYRFGDAREWTDAGLRDVFASPGLKLVEWPENAAALLPPCDLSLHLRPVDADEREVLVSAHSARGLALLP